MVKKRVTALDHFSVQGAYIYFLEYKFSLPCPRLVVKFPYILGHR